MLPAPEPPMADAPAAPMPETAGTAMRVVICATAGWTPSA